MENKKPISLIKVMLTMGMDRFQEACNIADVAIVEDGLRLNQRLVFVDSVEAMYPDITLEELTEIFIFRLKMREPYTWYEN